MNPKLKVVETTAETPAAIARRDHEATLADIDSESATVHDHIRRTNAVKSELQQPVAEQAALEAQLAECFGARLATGAAMTAEEAKLTAAAAAKSAEVAANSVKMRGVEIALGKLSGQLETLRARRNAELQHRQGVQFGEASERLDALAGIGEDLAAKLDAFNVEMIAAAIVRDHLRDLKFVPCAHQFKVAYRLPVPFGVNAFDDLGRHRDIGPDVQRRAAEILAELGADAGNIR